MSQRNDTSGSPVGRRLSAADARQGTARSPSGSIAVTTTERGLPTALKIDQRELKKSPHQLAREILMLCQLSAQRAQVSHRRELVSQGRRASVISAMKLATEEELRMAEGKAEEELRGDDELPASWMRSV